MSEEDKLSKDAHDIIEKASIVFVSAISGWEISLMVSQNKLELPMHPETWFNHAIKNHNLLVIPLDLKILFQANELPWHHKDPADRFIISTALMENASIVTGDTRFAKYQVPIIR